MPVVTGATIGDASQLNQAAYLGGGPLPPGWAQAPNGVFFDPTTGLTAVTYINQSTDSVYVAIRGTASLQDIAGPDASIALQGTPSTNQVALSYVESVQAQYPNATIELGGHSLGGEEAAFVSSVLGLPALVENAPTTPTTLSGQYGDQFVLQINENHDLVGNYGDGYSNTVTLDTGASWWNQWGTLGTHSIEGLNDVLYTVHSLTDQPLNSYSLDGLQSLSPYVTNVTQGAPPPTSDDVTSQTNPDGSVTYTLPGGGSETVYPAASNGSTSFTSSFPADTASGTPSGTDTGTINSDGSVAVQISYSDGTSGKYTDDGQGNTVNQTFDSSGQQTGEVTSSTVTNADGSVDVVTDTYGANGTIEERTDTSSSPDGPSTVTTDEYGATGIITSETTTTTDSSGNQTSSDTTYDENGNESSNYTLDPYGTATFTQYFRNGYGQETGYEVTVNNRDGSMSETQYNAAGEPLSGYSHGPSDEPDYGGSTRFQDVYDSGGTLESSTTNTETINASGDLVNTTSWYEINVGTSTDAQINGPDTTTETETAPDGSSVTTTDTFNQSGEETQSTTTTTDAAGTDVTETTNYTYTNSDLSGSSSIWSTSGTDVEWNSTTQYNSGGDVVGGYSSGPVTVTSGYSSGYDSGGGGGYSGGGYAFAGSTGTGHDVGTIAQYDVEHGNLAAAVAAQAALQQAGAAVQSGTPGQAGLEGPVWHSGVITWSLATTAGPSGAPFSGYLGSEYVSAVQSAFATWAAATGLTFEQVPDSAQSDIRIGWGSFLTPMSGILGYTNYSGVAGGMTGSIIRLEDPTQDPSASGDGASLSYNGTSFSQVLLHEIGHALGLGDSSDPTSIMHPTLTSENTTLSSTDASQAHALYSGELQRPANTIVQLNSSGQVVARNVLNGNGSATATTYNGQGQVTSTETSTPTGATTTSGYHYNSDGSYTYTIVSTPAGGGGATTTVYGYDAQGHFIAETVSYPDGSKDAYTYNTQGQLHTADATGADGSTNNSTYAYNADGSYTDTVVSTPAGGGGSTTTVYSYDPQGHFIAETVSYPDGSRDAYTYNSKGQLLTADATGADGSTNNSTYAYNSDGSYTDTVVATPASGGATTTVYGYDAQGHFVAENVSNPDGSRDAYTYNTKGQLLTADATAADGSTNNSTYAYNSDGSYTDTVVATPASGGATTTVYGYDAQGRFIAESVTNPDGSRDAYTYNTKGQLLTADATAADGSTNNSTYAYNSDGSYSDTVVATPAGGGATTTVYSYDAQGHFIAETVSNPDGSRDAYTYNTHGQLLTADAAAADGSTNNSTYAYNSDGSYTDTVVATPAGGGGSTTTVYSYDAQGRFIAETVSNPDGSKDAYTYNTQGQLLTADATGADGSTTDSTYAYNSDGSYTDTVVTTPAGGSPTTTVYTYDAQGHLVNEKNSLVMSRESSDTSRLSSGHEDYWWNVATRDYQDLWHNAEASRVSTDSLPIARQFEVSSGLSLSHSSEAPGMFGTVSEGAAAVPSTPDESAHPRPELAFMHSALGEHAGAGVALR
jgi:YD repeat-containing protein